MKKIDRLLLSSFVGPFFVAFGIALFVLIMQILWLYIDEIAGKGVGPITIFELVAYMSISVFPMALPIAMLISSVMVMGNLAERYELSSMKSAGISLMRVMLPLVFAALAVAGFSVICSNYLIPISNLQFKTRLYDIRKQKPALTLEAGVFNEDFRNFSIRIGKKSKDGETIGQVMIDDASQIGRQDFSQILADSGRMYTSADKRFFVMDLHRGTQYQQPSQAEGKRKYPFIRTSFEEYRKVWDMKEFDLSATDPDAFKENRTMLTMRQLRERADSLNLQVAEGKKSLAVDILRNFGQKRVPAQPTISPEKGPEKSENQLPAVPKTEKPTAPKTEKPTTNQPNPASQNGSQPPPGVGSLYSGTGQNSSSGDVKKQFPKPDSSFKNDTAANRMNADERAKFFLKKRKNQAAAPKNKAAKPAKTSPAKPTIQPIQRRDEAAPRPIIPAQKLERPIKEYQKWLETFPAEEQTKLSATAQTAIRGSKTTLIGRQRSIERFQEDAVKTGYELWLKYCFAAVCVVFLFIGAPLGAIIRKGGFGYPVIVSISFFMLFITLSIACRKLAESLLLTPFWAAMTPCLVLAPIGFWLTIKAMNDSQIFNFERYQGYFRIVIRLFEKIIRA